MSRALLVIPTLLLAACESESPRPAGPAPVAAALPAVASMDEATLRQWAAKGAEVWQAKTCFMCHSMKGIPMSGPSPIGVWGATQKMADGREVVVDEAFIRESILDPASAVTAGYPNQMPVYRGNITDEELTAIAALYRVLKDGPWTPAPGGR